MRIPDIDHRKEDIVARFVGLPARGKLKVTQKESRSCSNRQTTIPRCRMAAQFISRQFRVTALLPTAMLWTAGLLWRPPGTAQAPHGRLGDRLKGVQSGAGGR